MHEEPFRSAFAEAPPDSLINNAAGNFYTTQAVTFPLRARVKKGAMTAEMSTPQANGNCASCHAKPGVSGAPGRLYLQ